MSKTSFERHASSNGVTTSGYQGDNGRFADKCVRDAVEDVAQIITLCGVGAHHQNGTIEQKIKEITLIARTMLLHEKRMNPGYITPMLWPFAVKCAVERLNKLSVRENGRGIAL